jgi:simple sugar transport system permease protein
VLFSALIFGALSAGGNAMQRDAGVPSVVVNVVEATLILLVIAAGQWSWRTAGSGSAVVGGRVAPSEAGT